MRLERRLACPGTGQIEQLLDVGFLSPVEDRIPAALCGGRAEAPGGRGILLIGFGASITAVEVVPG